MDAIAVLQSGVGSHPWVALRSMGAVPCSRIHSTSRASIKSHIKCGYNTFRQRWYVANLIDIFVEFARLCIRPARWYVCKSVLLTLLPRTMKLVKLTLRFFLSERTITTVAWIPSIVFSGVDFLYGVRLCLRERYLPFRSCLWKNFFKLCFRGDFFRTFLLSADIIVCVGTHA